MPKKKVRRSKKRTNRKGGMKKTTSSEFKKARLKLGEMVGEDLERIPSSSSEELTPKTDYLWKRSMPQSKKKLTPRMPSTPRIDDDVLGPPDEDIELIPNSFVNRMGSKFGLRVYKNISERGIISTPNWTLVNGTFDPQKFSKEAVGVDVGTFKFINETRMDISLFQAGVASWAEGHNIEGLLRPAAYPSAPGAATFFEKGVER